MSISTDDMPADIKQAAYDCARGIYLAVDDAGVPYMTEDDVEEIAKAILAEREACAVRAEAKGRAGREWVPGSLWANVRREIAKDIRQGAVSSSPKGRKA